MIDILSSVKDYLNIETTDVSNDTLLNRFISSSQKEIENYLDQPIERVSYDVRSLNATLCTYKGRNVGIIRFPQFRFYFTCPISVLSIKYREEPEDDEIEMTDEVDYNCYYDNYVFIVELSNHFDLNYIYSVELDLGWDTTSDIPSDIIDVAVEKVAIKYLQSPLKNSTLGLNSKGESLSGGSSTTSYRSLIDEWNKRLNVYKRYTL
jgi:hypothetical protein